MNINPNFLISNIKLSFLIDSLINIHKIKKQQYIYKIYEKNHNLIIRGIFGTASILGKAHNHINLTGIKSFENIVGNIKKFCQIFDINLKFVKNIKIDCISAVSTVPKGLKNLILNSKPNHIYKIYNPPKFPGILLRGVDKICLTYFNSGKINIIGAKCTCEINKKLVLFNNFINFILL